MGSNGQHSADTGDGGDLVAGSHSGDVVPGLGRGREFDLIRGFLSSSASSARADVRLGPGDDAAVVAGDGIVLSADLSVEGVHFRREWLSPHAIGRRAAAAALSDLAAMAARPIGILVSLGIAPEDIDDFASPVMRGAREAVESVEGVLLGGDLTRSPGPLIVDVMAVGESAAPVTRSGAKVGDELWVTGVLGGAAMAVGALLKGESPEVSLYERFLSPVPRIREALWLGERHAAAAMIDLSDGLGGDLGHIAAASRVAAIVEAERVPVHPVVMAGAATPADGVEWALAGGEDYELCFAARPGAVTRLSSEFEAEFGLRLTRVGRVEAGNGVFIEDATGARTAVGISGFQHFGGEG